MSELRSQDLSKLPKWAREHIEFLTNHNERLTECINKLLQEKSATPTNFYEYDHRIGKVYFKAREIRCSTPDQKLEVSMSSNKFNEVEIRMSSGEGDGNFFGIDTYIRPVAGNVIKIVCCERDR